jgi:hypothetical protein
VLIELEPLTDLPSAVQATALAVGRAVTSEYNDEQEMPDVSTEYAAEIAWSLIYGQLRSRAPFPVPYDLLGVAVAVGIRWHHYVGNAETVQVTSDQIVGFGGRPQFTGFLLSELIVLWRYRVRTA